MPPEDCVKIKIERRKIDIDTETRLASAYLRMKHQPNDPTVRASYNTFQKETLDQFNFLRSQGYEFRTASQEEVIQKYPDVATMAETVSKEHVLLVAEEPGTMPDDHPMNEIAPDTGGWTHNQVFRAVHDMFGHLKNGFGFDLPGEYNAWRAHGSMYSGSARGAMTTETRARTAVVGYGPTGRENRKAIENNDIASVEFPEQKAGLVSSEFWTESGMPDANPSGVFAENDLDALINVAVPAIDRIDKQSSIRQHVSHGGVPLGSVIERWAPRLYGRLRQHQSRYRRDRHDADFQVKKLEDSLKENLSGEQVEQWLYLVQTQQWNEAQNLIADTVDNPAEINEQFTLVMDLKDQWRDAGVRAGLKRIGRIANHFPRRVKYNMYEEWSDKLTGEERSEVDRMLEQEKERRGRSLTLDEQVEIMNRWVSGYGPKKPGETSPRILSKRSVEYLSFEDWKTYYETDFTPLYSYFDKIVYNTHKARLFGKSSAEEDIDETIGRMFVEDRYGLGELSRYQKNRLKSAINSIYTGGEQSPAKTLRVVRDLGYAGVLLDPSSAGIQFGDMALTAVRDGSVAAARNLPKSLREETLTAKNMGMQHLSAEYGTHGGLARQLNAGFAAVGFKTVDQRLLTHGMVTARDSARRMVKNPNKKYAREWAEKWKPVFGDQWGGLLRDLQNGVDSDLVQDYAYMAASNTRPVDVMDMPEWFVKHPNARILYQLQGFAIKQFSLVWRNGYSRIEKGVRTGDGGEVLKGIAGWVRAMIMLTLGGAAVDTVRDWMLGRKIDFSRNLINGMLYTHLGSMYLLRNMAAEGPGSAIWDFLSPPALSIADSIWMDAANGTFKSVKHLPFGKTLYSFSGEHKATQNRYARRDALDIAAQAYADGDIAAARTYVNAFNDTLGGDSEQKLSMLSVKRSAVRREKGN